jgi:Protein of unknown function (DUF1236)
MAGRFSVCLLQTAGEAEEVEMKKLYFLSSVAAALLLMAGTAPAQMKDEPPARAPAAQRHAPAEKIAPSMRAGERKTPETTGQATKSDKNGKIEQKASEHKKPETTGQSPKESGKAELNSDNKDKNGVAKPESKGRASVKENAGTKSGASHQSSQSATSKSSATTGQGAAAGAAKLSTEQRTKITTIIKKQKVKPTHLNISVHVGAAVPPSVHFYPLPVEVVDVYPEWRGYDFILVGDEIIIVNPRTHRIVAILTA